MKGILYKFILIHIALCYGIRGYIGLKLWLFYVTTTLRTKVHNTLQYYDLLVIVI